MSNFSISVFQMARYDTMHLSTWSRNMHHPCHLHDSDPPMLHSLVRLLRCLPATFKIEFVCQRLLRDYRFDWRIISSQVISTPARTIVSDCAAFIADDSSARLARSAISSRLSMPSMKSSFCRTKTGATKAWFPTRSPFQLDHGCLDSASLITAVRVWTFSRSLDN